MSEFEPGPGDRIPETELTYADRSEAVERVIVAMERDELAFEELEDRFRSINRAATRAELERVAGPAPDRQGGLEQGGVEQGGVDLTGRTMANRSNFSILGDSKLGGHLVLDGDLSYTSVLGSVLVDLSSAAIPVSGVKVSARSILGDVKIILPDGVRVDVTGNTLLGDRTVVVVRPVGGAPHVTVAANSLLGGVKVYSLSQLPQGKLRQLWAGMRGKKG